MHRWILFAAATLATAGCTVSAPAAPGAAPAQSADIAALKARIEKLEAELATLKKEQEPPELGGQMLELQIRHARLWFAGDAQNWTLAAFQLHELRESLNGVVESNPEHASLQPQRLADVLPAMMNPALKTAQAAIDASDRDAFAQAYDGITAACNGCHEAASFGFNRFRRPRTPILDNQEYEPPAK